MKLLVDTHLLIWSTYSPKQLSRKAANLLSDQQNELYFSVVSLWEINVKRALHRPEFDVDPRVLRSWLLSIGYRELPVHADHVLALEQLPLLHGDPFDRLLLCQTSVEGLSLLTKDSKLKQYAVSVFKV